LSFGEDFLFGRILMFLPMGLNITGKRCLVVGGGPVAAHKCRILLDHGAKLRVVSISFTDEELWQQVEQIHSAYHPIHLSGALLVVAATNDHAVNRQIVQDCNAAGRLVLCADDPQLCDWSMPATLRRGAFSISFATDGLFPALAARIKRDSAAIYGDDLARLCEQARQLRLSTQTSPSSEASYQRPLRALADSLDTYWHLGGSRNHDADDSAGKVYLVGAGPGDVGLITVKGAECLRSATVVIHDALANNALLDMYCNGALRIDVSKRKGLCLHMQPEINQMLVDWARKGHTVVRLKGGDPMIFGRGGEEARALAAAGIDFEIVPGVSSLSAVPAYAGIPVTDREYGSASVGVYSLHRRNGVGLSDDQWRRMADGPETLVLLMGMTVLETAVEKLLHYGRKAETPIAVLSQGTTNAQQEVISTLGEVLNHDEIKAMPGPGLLVVGNVVKAKSSMEWFHPRKDEITASATSRPAHEKQLEVVLVRHAEIEERYRGRYIGRLDVPLGAWGLQQAKALATVDTLRKPGKIFASPMQRVRQTLSAVAPHADCTWLDDLREIDFGRWENCTFAEIAASDPGGTANWAKLDGSFAFPEGDSLESFQQRVERAARTILAQSDADESYQRIYIYAHGGVIRSLIAHWIGLPLRTHLLMDVARASISLVRLHGDRGVLTRLNDTTHLQKLESE
jgi:uroporphyrin-III C-methyltransferase/precorrin-2 dehydrogenase/sirohydrochlorin ferrochelatase